MKDLKKDNITAHRNSEHICYAFSPFLFTLLITIKGAISEFDKSPSLI